METTFQELGNTKQELKTEWVATRSKTMRTYVLHLNGESEPEVLYIISSGFLNMFHVIREDGYDNVGGSYALLEKAVVERKYDIKL